TECKRIADLADAFGKASTPHVSIGSAIQFAARVQVAAACPNQTWMEFWYGANPLGNAIIETTLRVEHGYLHVPDGPGLGIAMKEAAIALYVVPGWQA